MTWYRIWFMKHWLHLRREKNLKKSDKGSGVCFVWGPLKLPGCLAVTAGRKGQSPFRFGPRSHTLTHSNTQHTVWTHRTELIAGKQDIWVVFWDTKYFFPLQENSLIHVFWCCIWERNEQQKNSTRALWMRVHTFTSVCWNFYHSHNRYCPVQLFGSSWCLTVEHNPSDRVTQLIRLPWNSVSSLRL